MRAPRNGRRSWRRAVAAAVVLPFLLAPAPAAAGNFEKYLEQIDRAIAENPKGVSQQNLDACKSMRDMAVKLYKMGRLERAERRLKMCEKLLELR